MSSLPGKILATAEIESLEQEIFEAARAGSQEAAWSRVQPLRAAQHHQREALLSLLKIVHARCLPIKRAVEVASDIAHSHDPDALALAALGECFEALRDIEDLNAAPPDSAVFYTVVERLAAFARDQIGLPVEEAILRGLATSTRMLARQLDEIAETSHRKLTEIDPGRGAYHYNLGLFFKTRGRFEEGVHANKVAESLAGEHTDRYAWNLGICATGCRNGAVALEVWKRMGQKIEMGRFGLPEGAYPDCKVKLAERPLAERTASADDPGLEETVWIERLSPGHGIIRSVLYDDLGVDYGDIILMDGAPVTYHTHGDTKVPVFPHLATLVRQDYRFFDFAGTQDEPRKLAGASIDLEDDAVVYSHSENFQVLCANCWRDPNLDHEHHERMEKHVVIGRIAAPRHMEPARLLEQLDRAVLKRSPCQLFVPDLCLAAGDEARALVDNRRFHLLKSN
jgi:hypothetical protein